MHTTIRSTALAAILFAAASSAAFAADSADLTVKGVIKPAACNVTLAGGGILDFGTIAANTLSATAATVLPTKSSSFTVTCDAATKVMWGSTDNRAGTVNASAGPAVFNGAVAQFGVDAVGGKNVGAYSIEMNERPTADGQPVDMIATFDKGNAWATYTSAVARNTTADQAMSWATSGTKIPGAFKTMTQPFTVKLAIGKTGELPALTQDIAIDGSVTFSLKYL
ncbi:DUF1120 domain-containing protein [Cupriavidus pauculus]|uniref:DUF1120 domain-containing protein n=1 Tax=Cupriavidus pauculus TaxID=82633 RepID=A0A5P2H3E0_9BURK|nr:DUF1120 domain-containing protein [Cupriavidus pauculus]QET02366.1 DUF1120 domain-containing protein [Cupriavidus pauculus]